MFQTRFDGRVMQVRLSFCLSVCVSVGTAQGTRGVCVCKTREKRDEVGHRCADPEGTALLHSTFFLASIAAQAEAMQERPFILLRARARVCVCMSLSRLVVPEESIHQTRERERTLMSSSEGRVKRWM